MTTAANAINSFVEVGTITPGYAAVRAHRPLQGRLASRKALLTSTVPVSYTHLTLPTNREV